MSIGLSVKREFENGLGQRPQIRECMTTNEVISGIVAVAVVNLSMKGQSVSLSLYSMCFRAGKVSANWARNMELRSSK